MKISTLVNFMAEEDIGLGGEFLAYMALRALPEPWRMLRNLLVPVTTISEMLHDTEIDLVLLHTSGVYVLEVKEYSGWIFGNPKQKHWTQTLPDGRGGSVKHSFYNPLWQNYGHVQALKKNLAILGEVPIHSIVVFGDYCELKTQLSTPNEPVVHTRELAETVTRIAAEQGDCLGAHEVQMLYRYLWPLENPSARRREEQIKYAKSKMT